MRYFKKELVQNRITLKNGKTLEYTHVVDRTGLIETEDADLISQLVKIAGTRGISEISHTEMHEFKKKLPSPTRASGSQGPKLFKPNADPYASKKSGLTQATQTPLSAIAPPVVAPASANPVVVPGTAQAAVDPANATPAPSPARMPRRGRAVPLKKS